MMMISPMGEAWGLQRAVGLLEDGGHPAALPAEGAAQRQAHGEDQQRHGLDRRVAGSSDAHGPDSGADDGDDQQGDDPHEPGPQGPGSAVTQQDERDHDRERDKRDELFLRHRTFPRPRPEDGRGPVESLIRVAHP